MKSINDLKYVHFIGIAGISMSALAIYLIQKNSNLIITGSDIDLTSNDEIIKKMKSKNIILINKHCKKNINTNLDLVIYSQAITKDNIEFQECIEKKIKIISRTELLSMIMENYKKTICISGTHGKTTATTMISNIMLDNNNNPTIMIGGFFEKINGNLHIGNNDFFITEACEYKNSFLNIFSDISIILNIDNDHLDFFHNIINIKNSFQKFCNNTKELIILNIDDLNIKSIIPKINIKNKIILTFGKNNNANFYAKNIKIIKGCYNFDVYYKNKLYIENILLSCPGEHNMLNALSIICLSYYLNINIDTIKTSLKYLKNSKRRFEIIKNFKGATLINDYAHHPKEIEAIYNTVKTMNYNKIICVFQPHTFSRTIKLLDDFINILKKFDFIILIDIYGAREINNNVSLSSESISSKINNSKYITNKNELYKIINDIIEKDDVVLFLGAGDIDQLLNIF